jgi:hypothetical protein
VAQPIKTVLAVALAVPSSIASDQDRWHPTDYHDGGPTIDLVTAAFVSPEILERKTWNARRSGSGFTPRMMKVVAVPSWIGGIHFRVAGSKCQDFTARSWTASQ